ncbi:hypothetical protein E1B28_001926 [Marasmius oreades]|uniref:Uncharacterized protein n=1 Tax=Marasmius oreades TaxID=181124 RepID=A0A9P7V4R7_9AGAR|nr:uncharacterized protein E1B28_001926 [Marasmius oreades]KAG7100147.1 hypothetical protein E1B28_001926 [Marasmius oreades]
MVGSNEDHFLKARCCTGSSSHLIALSRMSPILETHPHARQYGIDFWMDRERSERDAGPELTLSDLSRPPVSHTAYQRQTHLLPKSTCRSGAGGPQEIFYFTAFKLLRDSKYGEHHIRQSHVVHFRR